MIYFIDYSFSLSNFIYVSKYFVIFRSNMWTPVTFTSDNSVPSTRSKHSAAVHGNHIYVVGGRNGNWPLKDIWRYTLRKYNT